MKYKPHILYFPKSKRAKFTYTDTEKLKNDTVAFDTLQKIADTKYSPIKKMSVQRSDMKLSIC